MGGEVWIVVGPFLGVVSFVALLIEHRNQQEK